MIAAYYNVINRQIKTTSLLLTRYATLKAQYKTNMSLVLTRYNVENTAYSNRVFEKAVYMLAHRKI